MNLDGNAYVVISLFSFLNRLTGFHETWYALMT